MRLLATVALLATLSVAHDARAQQITVIETEGPVIAITQTPRGAFVQTERGTFRATRGDCDGGLCLTPEVIRGLPERAPEGALPDGFIATAEDGDIRRAWYARPTDRYAHAVLGDAIEGGSLVIETADGTELEFVLPQEQVFEDITPRIADLDGDGRNEIVTIRASRSGGGSVVIFGLRDGALVQIGQSSENGRPNRWLNIAAIVPAQATGHAASGRTIVGVRTPHIGGRLFFLTMDAAGTVTEHNDIARDLSNHVIGSRQLDLAETINTETGLSLFIPSQDRRALRDVLSEQPPIVLPGPIDRALISFEGRLVTATEDGQLLVIAPFRP